MSSIRGNVQPARLSASGLVLVVAVVLSLLEALLIALLLHNQIDQSRVIDASGLQRTRTQRIAFLAVAGYAGLSDPGWKAEMLATVDDAEATRREMKRRGMPSGSLGPDGRTAVMRLAPKYFAAARALASDPHDRTAFEFIRRERLPILEAFDDATQTRAELFDRNNDTLVSAISVLQPFLVAILAGVWYFAARPLEKRLRRLLAQVTRQRKQLDSFIEDHPDLIGLYDAAGRLTRVNRARAAVEINGQGPQLGRHFTSFVSADYVPQYEAAFEAAKAGESSHIQMRTQVVSKGDVDIDMVVYPNFADDDFVGMTTVVRDVTEEQRASRRREESLAQMLAIFDQSPQIGSIYGLDGRLVRTNRAREKLLGYSEEELVGRIFWEFAVDDTTDAARAAFYRALAGECSHVEVKFANRNDVWLNFRITLFPYVVDGIREGVVALAEDLTGLRRMEAAEVRHSRRMEALYELAAKNISLRRQLEGTLDFAKRELGYHTAAAFEVRDDALSVTTIVGDNAAVLRGKSFALAGTITEATMKAGDVLELTDIAASPWREKRVGKDFPWRSYTGIPIAGTDSISGALAFASTTPRRTPLSDADRQFVRLVSTLVGALIERIEQADKLASLAFFDSLTDLPNRVHLRDRLDELLSSARANDTQFAVHFVDLDRFKAINDGFGHAAGDEILRATAARLHACAGERDVVARIAGDEFVILQPLDAGSSTPEALATSIVGAIEKPFDVDGSSHTLGASVVFARYPRDGRNAEGLLEAADRALYRAKRAGRGRWSEVA